MKLPRYILSLVVSLLMIAIGGVMVYFSATALANSVLFLSILDQPVGPMGVTPRDVLTSGGESPNLFLDVAGPMVVTAIVCIAGLALVVFGGFRLFARLRDGLPAEDEGAPKTETGRIGQLLLFGAGTAFGLWGLLLGALDVLSYVALTTGGQQTMAEVSGTRTQNRTRDGLPPGVYFDYSFQTVLGKTVSGTRLVPSSSFTRAYADGGEIRLYYSLSDPENHEFPALRSWSGLAQFMGFRLVLVVFGVWGLRRALVIGKIPPGGETAQGAPRYAP